MPSMWAGMPVLHLLKPGLQSARRSDVAAALSIHICCPLSKHSRILVAGAQRRPDHNWLCVCPLKDVNTIWRVSYLCFVTQNTTLSTVSLFAVVTYEWCLFWRRNICTCMIAQEIVQFGRKDALVYRLQGNPPLEWLILILIFIDNRAIFFCVASDCFGMLVHFFRLSVLVTAIHFTQAFGILSCSRLSACAFGYMPNGKGGTHLGMNTLTT